MLIGTANCRRAGYDTGKHSWGIRRARLGNLLGHIGADVWAFQELTHDMQHDLAKYLPGYTYHRVPASNKVLAWAPNITCTDKRALLVGPSTNLPYAVLDGIGIVSVHLTPYTAAQPIRDLEKAGLANQLKGATKTILAGDFNEPRPRINGFADTRDTLDGANEDANSYHGWRTQKRNSRWIDHIMSTPDVAASDLALILTGFDWETDHNLLTCQVS